MNGLYGRYVQKTYGLWEAAVSCHLKLTTAWHSFFITVHVPSMITNLAKNCTNPLPSLKLKRLLESHWFQSEFHGSSHLNFHISHVKSQNKLWKCSASQKVCWLIHSYPTGTTPQLAPAAISHILRGLVEVLRRARGGMKRSRNGRVAYSSMLSSNPDL